MATTVNGDSCVSLMKGTLVRPIARYPSSIAADAALKVASNQVETTLTMRVSSLDTIFRVSDTSRLETDMLLSIDSEIVSVSAIDATSSLITVVRGFDGTVPSAHNAGSALRAYIVAWHHNALAAEITAIETALGPNLSNIGTSGSGYGVMSTLYDFGARTPGGSLVVGANNITLAPVPQGVNGSDVEHYLYVSGGAGTAEAVKIIGGSAVAGAASGTLIIQCANTHSGPWSIRSATTGAQEALIANASPGGYYDVKLPNGVMDWYAPVHSVANTPGVTVSGQGNRSTKIQMRSNLPAFRFSDCYYPSVRNLEIQYWVTGTANAIEFTNCPVALVSAVVVTAPSGVSFVSCSGLTMLDSVVSVQAATGKGIYVDLGNTEVGLFTNNFITSSTPTGRAAVGFDIVHGTGIVVASNQFIGFDVNLNLSPSVPMESGGYVGGNKFVGNFFDGGGIGVQIVPTNGAYVERTVFTGNWFNSGATIGLRIVGTGGTVRHLNFVGNEFMLCGQDGINAQNATDITFTGNTIGNNSTSTTGSYRGMLLTAVTKAVVCGNQFGHIGTATHASDLLLATGVDQIAITGNSFRGWIDAPVNNSSAGQDIVLANNEGQSENVIPITAAASLDLDYVGEVYDVAGATAVTAMTHQWKNRAVTFIRTAAGSVVIMGVTLNQNGRVDCLYASGRWWCK
jgi:hypothetical protein